MAGETEIHFSESFLLLSYLKQYLKNEDECFITGSKHQETDESTRPKAECFYRFEVFESILSNTCKSVSSDIQNLRSGFKKRGAVELLLLFFFF